MRLLDTIRRFDRNGLAETIGGLAGRVIARVRREPARAVTLAAATTLCLVTVHNAAFGQSERHGSPWFGDPVETASLPSPEPATAAPKKQRALADPVVFGIQSELMDLGFYAGTIDGIAGSRTRRAIETYESANGLPVTGRATEALLGRIRVGAVRHLPRPSASPRRTADASATDRAATGSVPAPEPASLPAPGPSRETVRSVQEALIAAGEDLDADGLMGPNTRAAIEAYEEDRGLPVTGEPAPALLAHMRDAGLVR